MKSRYLAALLLTALMDLSFSAPTLADEPKQPDMLPAPKHKVKRVIVEGPPIMSPFMRTNRWAVWDYYEVSKTGGFRPRVIQTPYGHAYYRINGQPYPWLVNHPLEVTSRIAQ